MIKLGPRSRKYRPEKHGRYFLPHKKSVSIGLILGEVSQKCKASIYKKGKSTSKWTEINIFILLSVFLLLKQRLGVPFARLAASFSSFFASCKKGKSSTYS